LSRLIVDAPEVRTIFIAFGLFVPIWWTWVDFAVLYNRHGDDEPVQRMLFLTISVPVAIAAVATKSASHGHVAAFALSLAATRVMLAVAHMHDPDPTTTIGDALRQQTAWSSGVSAVVFAASIWIPSPYRYFVWAAIAVFESRVLFRDDPDATKRARRDHDLEQLRPLDPSDALDPRHFAERFALFMIILLGEVVAQAGESADGLHSPSLSVWTGLAASVVLAGALWWTYFDAAADIDLRVLEVSGGSPAVARVIFAIGHMIPGFALLMTSAGVGLLAHHDPPRIAYALTSVGTGVYLASAHSFMRASTRRARIARTLMTVGMFFLVAVHKPLGSLGFLCVVAAWACAAAALGSLTSPKHPFGGPDGEEP
jgi:low temperature requirement protein LtrA